MTDKIIELGRADPSVKSVISRLARHEKSIEHITCVITWSDKSVSIGYDAKSIASLTYESFVLQDAVTSLLRDEE